MVGCRKENKANENKSKINLIQSRPVTSATEMGENLVASMVALTVATRAVGLVDWTVEIKAGRSVEMLAERRVGEMADWRDGRKVGSMAWTRAEMMVDEMVDEMVDVMVEMRAVLMAAVMGEKMVAGKVAMLDNAKDAMMAVTKGDLRAAMTAAQMVVAWADLHFIY